MRRRTFLITGSSTIFAQSLPAPPAAKITSAVALWTLPGRLDEQLAAAARAGIQSVQLDSVIAARFTGAELTRAKRALRAFSLPAAAIVARAPGASDVLELAKAWDAPMVVLPQSGEVATVAGLRRAADLAGRAGVTLLVGSEALVREADHPHVKMVFDVAAAHERTGDAVKTFEPASALIKWIDIADSPGRREPGSGAFPFERFYQAVTKSGFTGHVAMSYSFGNADAQAATGSLTRSVDAMRRQLAATSKA